MLSSESCLVSFKVIRYLLISCPHSSTEPPTPKSIFPSRPLGISTVSHFPLALTSRQISSAGWQAPATIPTLHLRPSQRQLCILGENFHGVCWGCGQSLESACAPCYSSYRENPHQRFTPVQFNHCWSSRHHCLNISVSSTFGLFNLPPHERPSKYCSWIPARSYRSHNSQW